MLTTRLACVLAVALIGCRPPSHRLTKDGPPDSDDNQAVLGKLQGYFNCLREPSQRVFHIAEVYRARQVIEPAFDPEPCYTGLRDAKARPPAIPALDAAADRFAAALDRVYTLTTHAHPPELAAAFTEFEAAQAQLFDQVFERNHAVHADQIRRMEKRDGHTLQVRVELLQLRAEELIPFAATRWDHLDQIDLAKLTAALAPVEDGLEDVTSFAFAHRADADAIARFWIGLEGAKGYVAAARQLARRTRDKLAYTDAEKILIDTGDEAAIVGSPAALAKAYNVMVEGFGS